MWCFIKTLFQSLYRHTVGGLVRLVRHTAQATVDREDKQFVARAMRYFALAVVFWFFPVLTGLLLALRIMALSDVFSIVSNVYEDVVTAFGVHNVTTPA
jgi:hypothetical protein